MSNDTLGLACEHGMLARACEVCEMQNEIPALRAAHEALLRRTQSLETALDQERADKPLRIWIDAEWNSYKGALISFACVSEDDRMFYQEVVLHEVPDPWIVANVLPHLSVWKTTTRRSAAVEYEEFQQRLSEYIDGFDGPIEFVSDWPEDIEQLCRALIVGPGRSSVYRPITFRCGMGEFKGAMSAVPHHALHDARSLRDFALLSGRGEDTSTTIRKVLDDNHDILEALGDE